VSTPKTFPAPKPETLRQRAEFAASVRRRDTKAPVFLTSEAVDDLCTLVDNDARRTRSVRKKLRAAVEATDLGAARRLIDEALEELED
jgi:hypothetical protein